MRKRISPPHLCLILFLFLFSQSGLSLLASEQESPINAASFVPLYSGLLLASTNGILVSLGQVLVLNTTATEEKKVPPKEEAPIRILPSLRISEKD